MKGGEHLWSLCVEMQFYALAAAICILLGRRGLWLVPALCIAVTAARVEAHQYISIITWHRIDEILAGGSLALLRNRVPKIPLWSLLILLFVCSYPYSGAFQYFRPYAAALLVGRSLHRPPRMLLAKPMFYIANISYALYVVHGVLMATWLGAGDTKLAIYLKRPLLFVATFLIAHCSTSYFERPIIRAAKRLTIGKAELAANQAAV
jgi:peptidoglycan/LPS O-acetylase OafA/YrhL